MELSFVPLLLHHLQNSEIVLHIGHQILQWHKKVHCCTGFILTKFYPQFYPYKDILTINYLKLRNERRPNVPLPGESSSLSSPIWATGIASSGERGATDTVAEGTLALAPRVSPVNARFRRAVGSTGRGMLTGRLGVETVEDCG